MHTCRVYCRTIWLHRKTAVLVVVTYCKWQYKSIKMSLKMYEKRSKNISAPIGSTMRLSAISLSVGHRLSPSDGEGEPQNVTSVGFILTRVWGGTSRYLLWGRELQLGDVLWVKDTRVMEWCGSGTSECGMVWIRGQLRRI